MALIYGNTPVVDLNLSYPGLHPERYISTEFLFQYWSHAKKQALVQSTNDITIIADARIYNRRFLFDSLKLERTKLKTMNDVELILAAYLKWGVDCVHHLVGDFVFALWDKQQKQLMLVRDPLGQRSIFYSLSGKTLHFANLIRPLLDINNKNNLNRNAIAYFCTGLVNTEEHTFFTNIKKLSPGHYLLFQPDIQKCVIQRYWSPTHFAKQPLIYASYQDYEHHFKNLLTDITAEYVDLNYPLSCQLSGGLDSSAICSIAALQLQKENKSLPAFCSVPSPGIYAQPVDHWNYDDSYFMRAVSDQYPNVKLNFLHDHLKSLFEYQDLHYWLDQPALNPPYILCILTFIERALDLNIKTILASSAGNFTISWSPSGSKKLFSKHKNNLLSRIKNINAKPPWHPYSALNKKLADQANLSEFYHKIKNQDRLHIFNSGLRYFSASLYTTLRLLYGVDIADPTADKRIVEFSLQVPNSVWQNMKGGRGFVRSGLRGIMPDVICDRTCRGLLAADWYKKIDTHKDEITKRLVSWKRSPITEFINVRSLLKSIQKWNYAEVANSRNASYRFFQQHYGVKLLRGIELGLYLEKYLPKL